MTDFKIRVAVLLAFDRRCYHGLTKAGPADSTASQHAKGHDWYDAEQQGPEAEREHHQGVLKGFDEPGISRRISPHGSLDASIGHCFPRISLLVGHVIRLKPLKMRLPNAASLSGVVYATLATPLCESRNVRRAIS